MAANNDGRRRKLPALNTLQINHITLHTCTIDPIWIKKEEV